MEVIFTQNQENKAISLFFILRLPERGMGGSRVDGRLLLAYKADPILRNREGRLPSDLILCHDACVVEGCEAGERTDQEL